MTLTRASKITVDIDPADARGRAAKDRDIATAHRVLGLEIDGLSALDRSLGQSFSAAVDVIFGLPGRLIVTGMGKSGHVARKMASTLASTGTPAYFVHPSEASHGDLGMIVAGDAVFAFSWSGETAELGNIVTYTRRFGVPLIAATAAEKSPLGMAADVALVLPQSAEACPIGLAPTTSTTMMLALGDAISIALMDRRGFTTDRYRDLHPSGAIGRALLRVSDLMHGNKEIPLVGLDTPMADVLITMTAKSFGSTGVVDGVGNLVGIITDGDLRRHLTPTLLERRAAEVMTHGPVTIDEKALAAEALRIMNGNKHTCIYVVESGAGGGKRPIGILHIHDCLRAGVA